MIGFTDVRFTAAALKFGKALSHIVVNVLLHPHRRGKWPLRRPSWTRSVASSAIGIEHLESSALSATSDPRRLSLASFGKQSAWRGRRHGLYTLLLSSVLDAHAHSSQTRLHL